MSIGKIITKNDFKTIMENIFPSIDILYPVGSYFETSNVGFDPNETWGGTWELEVEGQCHVSGAASGTYQVSGALNNTTDGGAATHALTPDQTAMKAHNHGMSHTHTMNHYHNMTNQWSNGSGSEGAYTMSSSRVLKHRYTAGPSTNTTGGSSAANTSAVLQTIANGSAHNNMQPYIVVYRWHRTA